LKIQGYLDPLNQELKQLNKNEEAELLYQASRDWLNPETLWETSKTTKRLLL
jgi:hypothetical protein